MQSAKPGSQVPVPQPPVTHTGVASFATAAHGPQPPQCFGSFCSSTQVPLQFVNVAGQSGAHTPAPQTVSPVHATPALPPVQLPLAPQFELLVCGLMQVPPQLISGVGQLTPHMPPLQTSPPVHAVPAFAPLQLPLAPQFELLVFGSMQLPPQLISVPGQETTHVPSLHT